MPCRAPTLLLLSARGFAALQAAMANGSSDPLVIVSVVDEDKEDSPDTLQVLTDIQKGTLTPKWGDRILLPGVAASATIVLTCVHYDGNNPYFLGQSCLRLDDDDNWRKDEAMILPLGAMEDAYPPRDGAGKKMKFEHESASGTGEITVRVEPVALDQGFVSAVKKRGDREGGGFTRWKDRWIAMAGGTVHYYTEYGDPPRPKKTFSLSDATVSEAAAPVRLPGAVTHSCILLPRARTAGGDPPRRRAGSGGRCDGRRRRHRVAFAPAHSRGWL